MPCDGMMYYVICPQKSSLYFRAVKGCGSRREQIMINDLNQKGSSQSNNENQKT